MFCIPFCHFHSYSESHNLFLNTPTTAHIPFINTNLLQHIHSVFRIDTQPHGGITQPSVPTSHHHLSRHHVVHPVRLLLHLSPLRPRLHEATTSRSRRLLQCLPPKALPSSIPIPQLAHVSSLPLQLAISDSRSFQHLAGL